ncbi:MAG: FAD:protein FMN transferase [Bacteroidota bacterium]
MVVLVNSGCQQHADNKQENSTVESAFYQYTQLHLGVQVRIALYAEKEENAEVAAKASFARIAALEDIFSNYRPKSELSALSTEAYRKYIKVSDELFFLLETSQAFAAATDGAFDITLGPMAALWKQARKDTLLPDLEALAAAREKSGWKLLELDVETKSARLRQAGMQLDAGGIAKGYILDEAMQTLNQHGITSALIEAGGDLVVSAAPPGRAGWTIEVPGAPANSPIQQRATTLTHAAIATSGDTAQFVEINGIRYAHIINPKTGLGNTSGTVATVIAPNGITADKFATALTVITAEAATALLRQNPTIFALIQ